MERTMLFDTVSLRHSEEIKISLVSPLAPPPPNTKLVVFVSSRNYVAEYDSRKMLSAAAKYARKYNVWLVPERFALNDYICLCLIAPDGKPLGVSRACHLNLNYRGSFNRGAWVEPIDTPFGKVALLTDVDINMPHICRGYVLKGAELFIASFYIAPYDFSPVRATMCAENVAETNSIPIAAAIGGSAIIINGDSSKACPLTSELPATGNVIPSQWCVDKAAASTGNRMLLNHKEIFLFQKGE